MKKNTKVAAFVEGVQNRSNEAYSPFYTAYFTCFNAAQYYEAHDVLEHLWLQDRGNLFYKGLIQVAGGFVHLQKQALRPWHAKDGKRLRPAARLFALGIKNLSPFAPQHEGLDVSRVLQLCQQQIEKLEASDFQVNPWISTDPPQITLQSN